MVSDMDIHDGMLLMAVQVMHAVLERAVAYTSVYGHTYTHYMRCRFLNRYEMMRAGRSTHH